VQKEQTEWAYRYKKSSVIVKTNWIYVQNRQAEYFFIDTGNHQQLVKQIGFTCKNVKRSGYDFETDTINHQ
jgi:hypothetical protein